MNNTFEKMIAVTNRSLYKGDYLTQIEKICSVRPKAILLREKDLSLEEYTQLAASVQKICQKKDVPLILHYYWQAARSLGIKRVHLPLPVLREMTKTGSRWEEIGTSCHSMEQMQEAVSLGVSYIFLGNIYPTDCKPGLPGKGISLLEDVCLKSPVPVYAIGGIDLQKMPEVLAAGAAGGCMMSGFARL